MDDQVAKKCAAALILMSSEQHLQALRDQVIVNSIRAGHGSVSVFDILADGGYLWDDTFQVWERSLILATSQVIEEIDGIDPDNLQHVGNGVYRALWSPPQRMMDLEILSRTPGIHIVGEPYEPENLAGWVAVKFLINYHEWAAF